MKQRRRNIPFLEEVIRKNVLQNA